MTRTLFLSLVLSIGLLAALPLAGQESPQAPSETESETAESTESFTELNEFKLIQPERIHFSFIDFYYYETIKQVQEQMLSIPGLTDFIPYLETSGLLTYDLRYSGPADLLMKALNDVFGTQYELGMKEMGENAWEITMRKIGSID